MLCLQDWPRASSGFSEWLWRREQRTTEHTQSGLSPLTGSPPQSFTFMPPMLVATELVRAWLCRCVCMCAARGTGFFQAPERGHTPSANSTPPRPSCSLVRPQRADMKLDNTAWGWQRRLEHLPEPHTPLYLLSSLPPLIRSNYASAERIYTTQQAWIHRIIPCCCTSVCAPFLITITWPVLKRNMPEAMFTQGKKKRCYNHSLKLNMQSG